MKRRNLAVQSHTVFWSLLVALLCRKPQFKIPCRVTLSCLWLGAPCGLCDATRGATYSQLRSIRCLSADGGPISTHGPQTDPRPAITVLRCGFYTSAAISCQHFHLLPKLSPTFHQPVTSNPSHPRHAVANVICHPVWTTGPSSPSRAPPPSCG